MKNTYALFMITVGGVLLYSGYKGWTIADTVRYFTGQPQKDAERIEAKAGKIIPDELLPKEPVTPSPAPGPDTMNPNGDKELNPNGGGPVG